MILKEAERPIHEDNAQGQHKGKKNGASSDEHERRYITDLRVLKVSPSIKTTSGEPVWKLSVQFPWCEQSESAYLPITEGAPAPKIGTSGAILERGDQRKGASGYEDADFLWNVVTLESIAEESESVNDPMPKETQNTPTYPNPEQTDQLEAVSEKDAELRAHVALKASSEMVSGYLASSGQFKRDYTWKDMVEITTTVADAFLNWIDDATQREIDRRSARSPKALPPAKHDVDDNSTDASNIIPNGAYSEHSS